MIRCRPQCRLSGVLVVLVTLVGCTQWPRHFNDADKAEALSMGYGSLRQLLSDEASVEKILTVKSVSTETENVIRAISAISREALQQLESYQDQSPPVSLDQPGALPVVEMATRDSIATETALDLLFSSDTFEARLLMSQGQALRYGRFLALSLAERDSNEDRSEWLKKLADRYDRQYEAVVDLLSFPE